MLYVLECGNSASVCGANPRQPADRLIIGPGLGSSLRFADGFL